MKNKIKKILFSGILSLVLVFAFAFASLNVLRTDDRAHAADVSYHFEGALYLNDDDFDGIGISVDVVVDEDITIAQAEPIVSAAIEAAYPTIAVEELYLGGEEVYNGYNLNETKLSYLAMSDSTYSRIVLFEGYYGPKTNNQQSQKKIEFTTVPQYVENETSLPNYRYASGEGANDSFLVTSNLPTFYIDYNVTYNDGVNSLLLLPTFDTDFFEIKDVTVYNETAGWEEATITKDGFDRILLEGSALFSNSKAVDSTEAPVTLLRIKFATKKVESITGTHAFGLDLAKNGNDQNTYSQAFKWLDGTKLGEQEEVTVVVKNAADANQVRFFEMQTPRMEIKTNSEELLEEEELTLFYEDEAIHYLEFTYEGSPVTTKLNKFTTSEDFNDALEEMETPNLRVDYLYYGASTLEESNVIVNWYNATLDYSEEKDRVVKGDPINNLAAPTRPGWYVVEITVPQTGTFSSITKTGIIHIKRATLSITLENKTSEYGTTLATLTYMYVGNQYNSGTAFEAPNGEKITVNLSTTATPSSNVGHYDITAIVSSPNYIVTITNLDQKAEYTITARKITVRVEQGTQEVVYSGSEPTIAKDYTVYYAVVGNTITDGDVASALKEGQVVTLELVPYENVSKWNVGFYYIQAKLNSTNYEIADQTKGTLKITSQNVSFDNCFEGETVVYDGQEHELLKVVGTIPSYVNYEPTSVKKTNAGNYNITVKLTLSPQDAANYTNGETLIEIPVVGKILPRDIYVKAEDKSSYYGEPQAELTWVLDNDAAVQDENNNNQGNTIVGTDSLGITPYVCEGQTAVDVPHANAGEYTIDFNLSSQNPNYNIHKTTATYTINKINPQIAINAADSYNYNRPLNISAKVNNTPYAYVVKKGEVVQDLSTVLDAGEYTVVVSYAETTNYNALEETRNFTIEKVNLKAPTVTYSGKTATWTAVTTDAVENDNKDLYNATLTYTVTNGSGTISDKTYTAVVADKGQELTLHVASSNQNYNAVDVNLNAVYEVTFAEGSHEFNTAHATPMPASQLLFAGQKATAPTSNPALDGYTFAGWYLNDAEYGFANVQDGVTANIELVAHWNAKTYTITLSIRNANGEVEETEYEAYYNQELGTTVPNLVETIMILNEYPDTLDFTFQTKEAAEADEEYTADDYGKKFRFDTWMIDNEPKTPEEVVATKVTGDINLTIRYKVVDYVEFTVTYYIRTYVSNGNEWNTDYTGPYTTDSVKYGTAITYQTLVATPWFASDVWYLDEARNIPAPATMPNENINVYGAYVFDIGNGDVDADKIVSTDDIQVYREWIVGGYTISDISVDGTLPASKEFDNNNKYFLRLVADVNGDNSFDIRDVSTIRMTLVQNYGWDKETGYNVSGNEVVRNVSTAAFADISTALQAGNKVTLSGDVTAAESALALSVAGNVTLDLNGKTLTVAKVDLTVTNRGTLTVKNGTIVTTEGITLRAPYGNVTIEGVNGFDENGAVNLQAAEHSLHLAGKVGFYKGVDTTATPDQLVPAAVKVAQNTHVVLESAAELVVEKLVVAKVVETTENETVEFTVPEAQEDLTKEYTISIENNTVKPTAVTVQGYVDVETNEIKTFEELVAAGQKGGIYTLVADIDLTAQVVVSKALVLDLNGHTLSNTTDIWHGDAWSLISVQKGGDLTIKGNGTLDAKENDCYAVDVRDGANLVIENGTFVGNITAVYAYVGTVTINGGHFSIKQLSSEATDKHRFTLNLYDASRRAGTATIVVKGGEFENFNPSNNLAEGPKTNFVAAGYVVSALEDVYTVTTGNAIASVNDLINAITNCGNYVLMADVVYNGQASFAHDTTINLNGYKLQSTDDVALSATDGATLTLNGDGYVEAQEACVMAFDASHVVINGGTYIAHDNFVLGTNGSTGKGNNTITVNGGVFNGLIESAGYVACGIYVANNDTVVVNGGKFVVTNGVGILARSGNTTVAENVVFNVTGDGTLGKVGDSKVTVPSGAALVLDLAAGYPGGVPTLTNNTKYEVVTIANDIVNINNLAQLKAFRDDVNAGNNYAGKTVVLNADITLDGAWLPISNYSRKNSASQSKWFAGTFDGRGHVISGLTNASLDGIDTTYDTGDKAYLYTYGLFGSVNNAVIKNLSLLNVNLSSEGELLGDSVGALVGFYANSTQKAEANISNITVSGTVAGADNVGGVVGRAAGNYFKAENVTVNGTVTAGHKASGVVGTGNAQEMVFVKCVNHAAVSSTEINSNQGHNTVAGISITWKDVCQTVVLTNCSNDGALSTCNTSSLAGQLAVDYSPKTQLDSNGTWTYANGQWTRQ